MIRKIFVAAVLVFSLVACSATTSPYGLWAGTLYYNNTHYGPGLAVDYDNGVWAMCYDSCVYGRTHGWDMVDSVGDRIVGTYTGDTVRAVYRYGRDTFSGTLYPQVRTYSIDTQQYEEGTFSEFLH